MFNKNTVKSSFTENQREREEKKIEGKQGWNRSGTMEDEDGKGDILIVETISTPLNY